MLYFFLTTSCGTVLPFLMSESPLLMPAFSSSDKLYHQSPSFFIRIVFGWFCHEAKLLNSLEVYSSKLNCNDVQEYIF